MVRQLFIRYPCLSILSEQRRRRCRESTQSCVAVLTSWPAIDELSLSTWVKARKVHSSSTLDAGCSLEVIDVDGLEGSSCSFDNLGSRETEEWKQRKRKSQMACMVVKMHGW